jgi:23S rRNA (pseudouridine1915-N3)-methyltransferase
MKITIIAIGKFDNNPHKQVFETYIKRMKWKVELKELELKNLHNLSIEKIKTGEGELILKAIKPNSTLILLDENGKQFSSKNFSKLIADFALYGNPNLTFVIGGANGLSSQLLKRSDLKISIGLMTFPHMMVRAILAEQLYRAESIISNHPYHKE